MTRSLKNLSRVAIAALVVLLVSVTVLAYYAIAARSALCSFTSDLSARIEQQQHLLDTQPGPVIDVFAGVGGKVTLQVPRIVLENQVVQQRRTLSSIESSWPSLSC